MAGFDTNGVFTLDASATDAFPGKVLASADWNTIFQQIIDGMTQLGKGQIVRSPRIISAPTATVTVAVDDLIILIGAAVTNINLPASATKTSPLYIIGNAVGIFASNNATVNPNGAETIDGAASVLLSNDYQCLTLYPLVAGGWRILG
jgi:hypothetical protein